MERTLVLPLLLSLMGCNAGFRAADEVVEEGSEAAGIAIASNPGEGGGEEAASTDAGGGDDVELGIRGALAWREHRLEDALRLFEDAAAGAPDERRQLHERLQANALLALRRFGAAEGLLRRIIADNSLEADSLLRSNLAMACLRQGKLAEARGEAAAALQLEPRNVEAQKTLGLVDLALGDVAQAKLHLSAALERKADIPEAQAAMAEIEAAAGDVQGARARYQKLLAWLPERAGSDFNRRWRDLFHPARVETELKSRLAALSAPAGALPVK